MNRPLVIAAAVLLLVAPALAGGGPETTLVVVNSGSPVSRIVAAEYVALRDIPLMNVVHLTDVPALGVVTLDVFKEKIWAPIATHMEERGIADSIDLITYSADLPYGVDFRKALGGQKPGNMIGGTASLTGTTYLIRQALAGKPYWSLPPPLGAISTNRYFRLDAQGGRRAPRAPTRQEMSLSNRATQALQGKRLEEAAEAYGALVKTWKDPSVQYNYACVLALLGRKDAALGALEEAMDLGFPDWAHAAKDPDLISLRPLPEFQAILEKIKNATVPFLPTRGFRSSWVWNAANEPDKSEIGESNHRYYLSTQLAWTGFKGNSLPEITRYLRASAAADGTKPDGTVYICRNANVRSTTREPYFGTLIRTLEKLGRKVEILHAGVDGQNGIIPKAKDDVIGAVIGTAGLRWQPSKSRILPGAIVEHLTSFGAHFGTAGQTKLTEFMRYGAAGSSGTVVEPLAVHTKFPNPMIHAFYAEGCSLAEAFYQSVGGPYQLMIVGDGLCRPFAEFTEFEVDAPAAPWSGEVLITAKGRAARYELFVDGRLHSTGRKLTLDTTPLDDGWHDVRVVAVEKGLIETRSYKLLDAFFVNGKHQPEFEVESNSVVQGERLEISCRGATGVAVFEGSRRVGGGKGRSMSVSTANLGPGPVTLLPRAVFGKGPDYRGRPIVVEILPVSASPGENPDVLRLPGLRGRVKLDGDWSPIALTYLGDRFRGKTLKDRTQWKKAEVIELFGQIEAPRDGLYQILLTGTGTISLSLGGETLAADLPLDRPRFIAVSLEAGWHDVDLSLVPKGSTRLSLLLGGDTELVPASFRHAHGSEIDCEVTIVGAEPGRPIPVPPAGLEVEFERRVSGLTSVVLRPAPDAKSFPVKWVVETSTASRGKTQPAKDQVTLICAGVQYEPEYVEISFKATRARRVLIRAEGIAEGVEVHLSDVIPLGETE